MRGPRAVVARAENHVLPKITIQLCFQCLFDVDCREHAESLRLEGFGGSRDRLRVGDGDRDFQAVACFLPSEKDLDES